MLPQQLDYIVSLTGMQPSLLLRSQAGLIPPTIADDISRFGSQLTPALGSLNEQGNESEIPRHIYAELRAFWEKVGKFQQRKSTQKLTTEAFGERGVTISQEQIDKLSRVGHCIGISMKWAASKANFKTIFNEHSENIHEDNSDTVLDGALGKMQGLEDTPHNYRYATPIDAILAKFGLEKTSSDRLAGILQPDVSRDYDGSENSDGIELDRSTAEAFSQACNGDLIPPGATFMVFLTVVKHNSDERFGHAVSIHRDDGGGIHFFDPDVGEYAVKDVNEFFDT
jgi:hypothetical protein